jgi:hypothetical protein
MTSRPVSSAASTETGCRGINRQSAALARLERALCNLRRNLRPYESVEFLGGTQQIHTVQCFPAMIERYSNTMPPVTLMQPVGFIKSMPPQKDN